MAFTLLIIRGDKVPSGMIYLLEKFGIVKVYDEKTIVTEDGEEYIETILYVSGDVLSLRMQRALSSLGTITINEEHGSEKTSPPRKNKSLAGEEPPMYLHKTGTFTPSLFIRALERQFTHFDDVRKRFLRIENFTKVHIYSNESKLYALMETGPFMHAFQRSEKTTFGERIEEILADRHNTFVIQPKKVGSKKAIELMQWDQSLMAFFTKTNKPEKL